MPSVHNGPSKTTVQAVLRGHRWTVSGVDFHPAGNMVVTGSWDRTIRIWDAADGKELRRLDRNQHVAPITSVKWHPNGALVASTSADNTTALWDAATGKKMRTLREHFGWVLDCSFAPDRTKFATASWDKTVRLWDPNTGELISTLRGHTKGVWACAFYPVGHTSALLATGGEDCTARLWDTRTRKVALTLSGGHSDAVYSVAWSGDGSMIATGGSDRVVTVWDPKAGKILRQLKGHTDTVKRVAFSPQEQDNGVAVLASAGGYRCNLWNSKLNNNHLVEEMDVHEPGLEIECVDISADGSLVATGARDGTVKISTIPYVPKMADVHTGENRVSHQDWRKGQLATEAAEWQDVIRKRRESMAQKAVGNNKRNSMAGKLNETTILSGFEREPEREAAPRAWNRHSMAVDEAPEVVKGSQPAYKTGMLQDKSKPAPQNKQVGDVQAFMASRKAATDSTAEKVAEHKRVTKPPPRKPTQEETLTNLMAGPGVNVQRKVKVRQFSVKPGKGGKGLDSNARLSRNADSAFANM